MRCLVQHIASGLILYCSCLFTSYAQQDYYFDQVTSDKGLSENVVYCLLQDKKGFIWAGTDFGLNRLDGYSVKKFYHDKKDSNSIAGNSIQCLAEDSSGKIWIGAFNGLSCYDPETSLIRRVYAPVHSPDFGFSIIQPISRQHLLLSNEIDIWLYDIKAGSWKLFAMPAEVIINGKQFFRFPGNQIAVPATSKSTKGLLVLDTVSFNCQFKPVQSLLPFAKEESISYYFHDGKDRHFIFSNDSDPSMYDQWGKRTPLKIMKGVGNRRLSTVQAILETSPGKFWVCTASGLFIIDSYEETISTVQLTGGLSRIIPGTQLNGMIKERGGNIWIATFGEGLLRCENQQSPFRKLELPASLTGALGGMIAGLSKWPGNKVAVQFGERLLILDKNHAIQNRIAGNLPLDTLVLATTGRYLADLNAWQRQKLQELHQIKKLYPFQFSIYNDSSIITFRDSFTLFSHIRQQTILRTEIFECVYAGGAFWLATPAGLYRINSDNFSSSRYLYIPNDSNSLSESWVYSIAAAGKNSIWIGTKGGGLNHLDIEKNKFTYYTEAEGLPNNVIYFILPDKWGNLWLTTNNGISKFNIQSKTFTNFSRRDGLLNSEYNRRSGAMTEDSTIFFAGTSGIDFFNPKEVAQLSSEPHVNLSSIKINNQETSLQVPAGLKHFENNFTVSYTANDFTRPDLVYYRYRLKENDPWTRVQGIHTVTYNALLPGSYVFEVQSSYDNQNWSNGAVYNFSIEIPWWKSGWFYFMVAMIISLGLYFFYRYRINQLKKMQQLRSKISKDLHDEVGSTLSSIHVYSSVASRSMSSDVVKAKDALDHINVNARRVMENMSDIVWAINNEKAGESSLEAKLKNYGYELLNPLGIECTYEIDQEADKLLVNMEARKNILLIAKEAMNNIARHSKATKAIITAGFQHKRFVLQIWDNGEGIENGRKRTGNGLANMKQRAGSLGGSFNCRSEPAKGTEIECSFPITRISE